MLLLKFMLINSEIILLHLIDSCQHVACELKGRVVAKENVGWLKSKVSWHGCDMLVFAGLPSLSKTKLC